VSHVAIRPSEVETVAGAGKVLTDLEPTRHARRSSAAARPSTRRCTAKATADVRRRTGPRAGRRATNLLEWPRHDHRDVGLGYGAPSPSRLTRRPSDRRRVGRAGPQPSTEGTSHVEDVPPRDTRRRGSGGWPRPPTAAGSRRGDLLCSTRAVSANREPEARSAGGTRASALAKVLDARPAGRARGDEHRHHARAAGSPSRGVGLADGPRISTSSYHPSGSTPAPITRCARRRGGRRLTQAVRRIAPQAMYATVCDEVVTGLDSGVASCRTLLENIFRSATSRWSRARGPRDRCASTSGGHDAAPQSPSASALRHGPGGRAIACRWTLLPVWPRARVRLLPEFIELAGKRNQAMPYVMRRADRGAIKDAGTSRARSPHTR